MQAVTFCSSNSPSHVHIWSVGEHAKLATRLLKQGCYHSFCVSLLGACYQLVETFQNIPTAHGGEAASASFGKYIACAMSGRVTMAIGKTLCILVPLPKHLILEPITSPLITTFKCRTVTFYICLKIAANGFQLPRPSAMAWAALPIFKPQELVAYY